MLRSWKLGKAFGIGIYVHSTFLLLVAFVLVHVFEVIVSGFWNHLRSMITGRYRVTGEAPDETAR